MGSLLFRRICNNIMRVVHLSYDYGLGGTGGGPIAASRLHLALIKSGVDSHFVCVRQLESGPNVHCLPKGYVSRKVFYLSTRIVWVLSKMFTGRILMPNIIPLPGFSELMRKLGPDIVHVHFINQDMLSYAQLSGVKAKFVYTLHDLTIVNALNSHPIADRRFVNGFLPNNSSVLERWMFARKKLFIENLRPIFLGPSDWICRMFKESIIGRGFPVYNILNIIDSCYKFDSSQLVVQNKFTLLFGAWGGRSDPYKGWDDLVAALKLLPEFVRQRMVVLVFGESAAGYEIEQVEIRFAGRMKNASQIHGLHYIADIFVLPSRYDNAPQVKFEALSDGLPVIAFSRTGCAEYIQTGENGWVVSDGDFAGYAKGLNYFFDIWQCGAINKLRHQIAEKSSVLFSDEKILCKLMHVYDGVVTGNTNTNRN